MINISSKSLLGEERGQKRGKGYDKAGNCVIIIYACVCVYIYVYIIYIYLHLLYVLLYGSLSWMLFTYKNFQSTQIDKQASRVKLLESVAAELDGLLDTLYAVSWR